MRLREGSASSTASVRANGLINFCISVAEMKRSGYRRACKPPCGATALRLGTRLPAAASFAGITTYWPSRITSALLVHDSSVSRIGMAWLLSTGSEVEKDTLPCTPGTMV